MAPAAMAIPPAELGLRHLGDGAGVEFVPAPDGGGRAKSRFGAESRSTGDGSHHVEHAFSAEMAGQEWSRG